MEKFNRAVRRHHIARLKKARKSHWNVCLFGVQYEFPFDKSKAPTPRQLGRTVSTAKLCSCWMCNRPRKVFGRTLQELSFAEFCKKVEADDE